MTQDELEAGTLVGAVKSTQGGPAAMMELLTSAIETAKTTRKRDFLELDHVHRRCPLHYLCGNPKSTPEMLRALIEEEPRALLVVDKNGMTPAALALQLNQRAAHDLIVTWIEDHQPVSARRPHLPHTRPRHPQRPQRLAYCTSYQTSPKLTPSCGR